MLYTNKVMKKKMCVSVCVCVYLCVCVPVRSKKSHIDPDLEEWSVAYSAPPWENWRLRSVQWRGGTRSKELVCTETPLAPRTSFPSGANFLFLHQVFSPTDLGHAWSLRSFPVPPLYLYLKWPFTFPLKSKLLFLFNPSLIFFLCWLDIGKSQWRPVNLSTPLPTIIVPIDVVCTWA